MTKIIGPSGLVIDVDQSIADGLVDGGHARYVTDGPEPAQDVAPEPVEEASEPSEEKPKGNASLEEWSAYATTHGKDVTGLSRDEIRTLFKGE